MFVRPASHPTTWDRPASRIAPSTFFARAAAFPRPVADVWTRTCRSRSFLKRPRRREGSEGTGSSVALGHRLPGGWMLAFAARARRRVLEGPRLPLGYLLAAAMRGRAATPRRRRERAIRRRCAFGGRRLRCFGEVGWRRRRSLDKRGERRCRGGGRGCGHGRFQRSADRGLGRGLVRFRDYLGTRLQPGRRLRSVGRATCSRAEVSMP